MKKSIRRKISPRVILSIALAIIILAGGVIYASGIFGENESDIIWNSRDFESSESSLLAYSFDINTDQLQENIQAIRYERRVRESSQNRNTQSNNNSRVVTYTISTRGNVRSSLPEFRQMAAETLNDPRGWVRAGITFQEVPSGGQFSLILSEARLLPEFSVGCSAYWSCRVGRYVIINDYRWVNATPAWNAAGGSLRDYRHMVLNHEVGHFLGHPDNNYSCGGLGHPAPVMQQQSINLRGCVINPWPLDFELWTNF